MGFGEICGLSVVDGFALWVRFLSGALFVSAVNQRFCWQAAVLFLGTSRDIRKHGTMKKHNIIGICAITAAAIALYTTTGWHWLHAALTTMAILTIIIDRKSKH